MSAPPATRPSSDPISWRSATTLFNGFPELYLAYAEPLKREIVMRQFFEKRPDLGEISFMKDVPWEESLPPGAELFLPTSGLGRDVLKAFWLGWREGPKLSVLSIFQDKPMELTLSEGERAVEPAVMVPSKRLQLYVVHGKKVGRHEWTGEDGRPGSLKSVALLEAAAPPLLPAAGSVPDSKRDEAVLGWVEADAAGLTVALTSVVGTDVKTVRTHAVPGYQVFARQRSALTATLTGELSYRFLAERTDAKGYAVMEATCRVDAKTCELAARPVEELAPEALHSAASFFYKGPMLPDDFQGALVPRSFSVMLTREGVMLMASDGSARPVRKDVAPTYDFPVVTGEQSAYEVRLVEGTPALVSFP